MAGELIVADYQEEYDGLLLGDGTAYELIGVTGLLDLPAVDSADRDRLLRHGRVAGADFLSQRITVWEWEMFGADPATLGAVVNAFTTATRPGRSEIPLAFQLPGVAGGGKRILNVRPRRRDVPLTYEFANGRATAAVQFDAMDPRIYDADLSQSACTLPVATVTGLSFPLGFPLGFGSATTAGTCTVNNTGNFDTEPVLRIDGPLVNPFIQNMVTGATLSLTYTLADGDFLLIDCDQRSVLLNGTANRYGAVNQGSSFPNIPPGVSAFRFGAASYSSSALLTVSYRSAWV